MLKVCYSGTKTQPSQESEAKGTEGLLLKYQQPGEGRGRATAMVPFTGGTTVFGWAFGQNHAM